MEDNQTLKTYFNFWKKVVKVEKERKKVVKTKLEQKEKFENLIKAIKRYQKEKIQTDVEKQVQVLPSNTFKNRFNAQKSTIEKLTLKLEEKDRLINELKLGILDKEALKSINESKIEIREIFAKCTKKIRCKIPPPVDFSQKFMVSTQKAPKILQEMEERAMERAKRREIILERKRLIEEKRRLIIQQAIESKRVQDEEEKRRSLERIKVKRREEMEIRQKREAMRLVYMEKVQKAVALRHRLLLNKGFKAFFINRKINGEKFELSGSFYRKKLINKTFGNWKIVVEMKYYEKNAIADAVFAKNVLVKAMETWKEFRLEAVRCRQVAEDFYDLLLLNNTFVHWHRYVCVQIMLEEKKIKKAEEHYRKHLLFNSFYQWRSLPAVIQLEKSKELKLKKWREKVWSILPDYKPPTDD